MSLKMLEIPSVVLEESLNFQQHCLYEYVSSYKCLKINLTVYLYSGMSQNFSAPQCDLPVNVWCCIVSKLKAKVTLQSHGTLWLGI